MELLAAIEGTCAGDRPEAAAFLYTWLQERAATEWRRFGGLGAEDGEDTATGVLLRLHGARERYRSRVQEEAASPRLETLQTASRYGLAAEELSALIGRPLSPAERAALDPFTSEASVVRYLVTSLRNGMKTLCKRRGRRVEQELPPDRDPDLAVTRAPGALDAGVVVLLERMLVEFVAWGNARSAGGGDRNLEALDEVRRAAAAGLSAAGLAEEELPGGEPREVKKLAASKQKRWTRARDRFYQFARDERRSTAGEREMMPDLLRLFDVWYRVRARGVRKRSTGRPASKPGVSP